MKPTQVYLSPTVNVTGPEFGHLSNPRTQILPKQPIREGAWWGMDNDCFNGGLDLNAWSRALFSHLLYRDRCLFAVSPDVVGDYRATLALFDEYAPRIKVLGYPVALATQDGLTPAAVPWNEVDVLFIGGNNKHKLGPEARALIDAAKERGKWVHVGRVNKPGRLLKFWDANSWDGTDLCFAPNRAPMFARAVRLARAMCQSPNMFKELTA